MCGIVCALTCLYCRSRCQASVVASALAFHPPNPLYKLEYDEKNKNYTILLDSELPVVRYKNVRAEVLTTKSGTKVPLLRLLQPGAKYTILYSHGNATDCGAMFYIYALLAVHLDVNVVGYDYTGYGASAAYGVAPTEKQTYKDIECVYDWICESGLVTDPSTQLILYGQSVGSGPSTYLASEGARVTRADRKKQKQQQQQQSPQQQLLGRRPVAALVLHSPIMSGLRVLTESRFLACFDIFPNITRVKNIKVPLFIIHGQEDVEVKVTHGERLLRNAPERCRYAEPWWVAERGHNNVLHNNESAFIARMRSFLDYVAVFHAQRISSSGNSDQPTTPLKSSVANERSSDDDNVAAGAAATASINGSAEVGIKSSHTAAAEPAGAVQIHGML